MLNSQLGERATRPPRQGDNSGPGSLAGAGDPGWDSTSALRSHPGAACARMGTARPPGDHDAPRRTECLDEALSDPVTWHTLFAGLHPLLSPPRVTSSLSPVAVRTV